MFNLREFIKKGFLNAIGKMADYQIILNATGWYDKGVLLEEDLAEINTAIENQYIIKETEVVEDATDTDVVTIEETEENTEVEE